MSSVAIDQTQVNELARRLMEAYPPEYLRGWSESFKYIRFQTDIIGFGEQILRERYTRDVKKLMVSVMENNTTIAISGNGTGKTHVSASIAIWFYMCFPNAQIFSLAAPPLENLKRLLWGEIGKKIAKNPKLFEDSTYNVMRLAKKGKEDWHYIVGVAIPQSGPPEVRTSKFSGKHSENLMFVVDEADAVNEEVFAGISNCLSGGNIKLVCLFNPKLCSGFVYRKIRDGQASVVHMSALNHPNVVEGSDLIKGAVSREVTVKRINECSMALYGTDIPDSSSFEVPDFLVGAVAKNDRSVAYPPLPPGFRRITDPRFFYQVLGQFGPQGENQLINKEWIDSARLRWDQYVATFGENPPEAVRPKLGLDVASMGADSNSLCLKYGDWVARFQRWKGIEPHESSERVADIALHVKSECVYCDGIGVGVDVVPLLRKKKVKAVAVIVSNSPTKTKKEDNIEYKFHRLRDQLLWEVRDWISTPTSMIPPDERLMEEMLALSYEEDKITRRIRVMSTDRIKEILGRSPDTLMSLTMLFCPKPKPPRCWSLS